VLFPKKDLSAIYAGYRIEARTQPKQI
jgi:hypothetical protein